MADGGSPGGPGEAAVGDEGHLLVQPHAGDGRGGIEHLPHAGPALGALIADDHHVAGDDFPGVDGGDGLVLGVEHPGRAGMDHHLRGHGGLLHNAALGGQGALEHGDAAIGGVGVLDGTDDVMVQIFHALQIFRHRPAGGGDTGGIQQSLLGQLLHNGVYAARPVQVLHKGVAGGGQVTQVGGAAGDVVGERQAQLDAALVGDGR